MSTRTILTLPTLVALESNHRQAVSSCEIDLKKLGVKP